MRAWFGVLVAATVVAAACWHTKTNPAYCEDDRGCVDPLKPVCDAPTHTCIFEGGDLGGDMTQVDLARMCTSAAMCTVGTARFCGSDGNCRACGAGDCSGATPICATSGTLNGACVTCTDESQCAGAQHVCEASTGTCRACAKNTECGSGICEAGLCVLATEIVYVNNNQTPCTGADGTRAKAYCDVNTAITNLGGKTRIYVEGSATGYPQITLTGAGLSVSIVGPGKSATTSAQFKPTNAVAALLTPTSGTTSVVLDGLELIGENSMSKAGVICSGAAATVGLTVRDCYIHASGAAGVDSSACALNLARNFITDNKGGITVTGGTYDIQNNLIYSNSSALPNPGVNLDATTTGTFRFNTVANNTAGGGGRGGIECGAAASKAITDSIVIANTAVTSTQVGSQCALTNVATGGSDGVTGAFATPPTFKSGSDFHLKPGDASNATCCVNKASTSPTPPALDVDDTVRPKGGAPDVGAHEVE